MKKADYIQLLIFLKLPKDDMILEDWFIDALYLPEDEAKRALKNPAALYYKGAVYSWTELVQLRRDGTLDEKIPAADLMLYIRDTVSYCVENGIVSMTVMQGYLNDLAPDVDSLEIETEPNLYAEFGIGGSSESVYARVFITIPGALIQYVGSENFNDWLDTVQAEHPDDYTGQYINLYEFIRYFGIGREAFEEIYYTSNDYYAWEYDLDMLFSDDAEAVYDYYRVENYGAEHKRERQRQLMSVKFAVQSLIDSDDYTLWMEETVKNGSVASWSIAEAVYRFDIPEDALVARVNQQCYGIEPEPEPIVEEVYEDGSTKVVSPPQNNFVYVFDLSVIYDDRAEFEAWIADEKYPVLVDEHIPYQYKRPRS